MMKYRVYVILIACMGLPQSSTADTLPSQIEQLFDQYCLDCHGADAAKGGLHLDSLSRDFPNLDLDRRWVRVFDKLSNGDMPPKAELQPPPDLRADVTTKLREALHRASITRQQLQGRVQLRRLNGVEYENTLHELLGIRVPLRELLPEDGSVGGFDNVATALDLSATHFLRYQEAAARAVTAVVPVHPPIPFRDRRTGLDMTKKGPNFREGLGRNSKLDGESLIVYSKLPRYGLCATAPVPTAGRYRIRLKASAIGEEGQAIPVGLMTVMQSGREPPVLHDVRDIPHGEPQVFEFEHDLVRQQAFVVNLLTTWDIRRFKRPIEEYTGPGLRVEWMEIEGPLDAFPPPRYANLFQGVPLIARSVARAEQTGKRLPTIPIDRTVQQWEADPLVPVSEQPTADMERLIGEFLPRAFRRPVSEAEQAHYISLTRQKFDEGYTFYDAMQYGYQLILCSPSFLFLTDPPPLTEMPLATHGRSEVPPWSDFALASRLSYFLWSSPPDDELLSLAARGQLHHPPILREQVERMLDSPKSQRLVKNFVGQWLDLRRLDFTIPDPILYSDFDQLLLWSMPKETELFFSEMLRDDLSLLDFVDSDWSMLNERLATLYGIPGLSGSSFQKTRLPTESHRGGVLTHASVLKVTADGTRTSPVLRGAWVLDRILGTPPEPPPPDIPPIEPDIRGATTIREQLDKHRNTPACAACHKHIDPPGFALENFDPIGNWREFYRVTTRTEAGPIPLVYGSGRPIYRGPPVEQGGQTHDGKAFRDIADYKRLLFENHEQIARNLTSRFITYATGAEIQFADREVVDHLVSQIRAKRYGLRSLIHEVVQSRVFLMK